MEAEKEEVDVEAEKEELDVEAEKEEVDDEEDNDETDDDTTNEKIEEIKKGRRKPDEQESDLDSSRYFEKSLAIVALFSLEL